MVYPPSSIQQAYNFGDFANGGSGQAIAIIDAYGDPTLTADLAIFNSKFGLPSAAPTIVYPDGVPTSTDSNWAIETALDVEWAHANAPNATIYLVVAPDASFGSLLDAISYAVNNLNVAAISMSFGAPEINVTASTRDAYEAVFATATSDGIMLLASSGDNGAYDGTHPRQLSADYPAASPQVIGVGGTTLTLTSSGDYGSETAWKGSGGGYSVNYSEPDYQLTAQITDPNAMRGIPDVAFDADPNTGVYVYCNGSWYSVGGTSVGAPNWAAIVADNTASASPRPLGLSYIYSMVYGNTSESRDVTSGKNGYYSAGTGWDAVTGIGTPNVSNLLLGK